VLSSGACGFAVFYGDDHYLNMHGSIDCGESPAESNLAELAALFWALRRHPRGQTLAVFSDSAHALRAVQALCEESDEPKGSRKRRGRATGDDHTPAAPRSGPRLDQREQALVRAIGWMLRLRTAHTSFFKVPGHRGFTQNTLADALARRGAESGPAHQPPLRASLLELGRLLVAYLLDQSALDGGLAEGAAMDEPGGANGSATRPHVRRPQPLSDSAEMTHVLALDCEMVGVGAFGGESRLASVVVVNDQGNQVYASYAKPPKHITDYRTKWSGITPQHLLDAPPAAQVQQEVRRLVEGHVVVGHSLENDFRVLGFFPPREMMRDTAHDVRRLLSRGGRPRKLRRITWEFLGMTIQDSDEGHDPLEDARAALLLYRRFREEFEARAAYHAAEAQARRSAKLAKAE
jgi:RNA exonuclease 4